LVDDPFRFLGPAWPDGRRGRRAGISVL